jgi:hypothetical protein
MKNKLMVVAVIAGLGFATASLVPSALSASLPQDAVSENSTVSTPAINALRAEGPAGLQSLLEAHAALIHEHETNGNRKLPPENQAAWERLRTALDKVSGQRDCHASHLYWYTDLEQAKAAARASGKPILSLRLLGRLDEEYSCANSRFFRTTLYANAEVSQYLRDHFILHWKSVRPVPRITIDFGDGRKIERTVTGNSIHYVLDSDGEPVDALPGLYGPKAFLKGLADAEQAARKYASLNREERDSFLRLYHADRNLAIATARNSDLAQISNMPGQLSAVSFRPPSALAAGGVAVGKSVVEIPMLRSFQDLDDATWTKIALLHQDDAALDAGSQKLILAKNPTAYDASRVALSKSRYESPFVVMMRNLQRSIAEDTVRNEYVLHAKIHDWFASGAAPKDLDRLNSKIYAELFLTPDSDPWLGLVPANTFTGLDNNGLAPAAATP